MEKKLHAGSSIKIYTIKEQLKRKRIRSIVLSVCFSALILLLIIVYAFVYNDYKQSYFDSIAETRINNSSIQLKKSSTDRIDGAFTDAKFFDSCYTDSEIITSNTLDKSKLQALLDDYESYLIAEEIGVFVDNKLILETETIDYNHSKIESEMLIRIDDYLYFLAPSTHQALDGTVSRISVTKMNSLFTPEIYNGESSIMICDANGDNLIVGDAGHGDRINGNCLDDIKRYYPKDSYDRFANIYSDGETHIIFLDNNPPIMLYKTELSFGNDNGKIIMLFFAPRSVLTDQLSSLSVFSTSALNISLVLFTVLVIALYLLLIKTVHKSKENASYDECTCLLNEESFYHDSQATLFKYDSQFGIISMNIRGFQKINQLYGTSTGDSILQSVGKILIDTLNEANGDISGYQNGDTFLMLLKGDMDEVIYKLTTLNNILTNYKFNDMLSLSFSFGIKMIDINSSLTLRHEVDCAQYAERRKKDVEDFCFYDDETVRKQRETDELISRFDEAIENREFKVYFQLKWDLKKNCWGGAEALVRWIDPIKGLISPGKFVPIFEENGFITRLDRYMLKETCILLASMLDNGETCVPVSVNLSKRNFTDISFIDEFNDIVNKYCVPHNLIQFEITEGLFIDSSLKFKKFIRIAHDLGYSVSMDDFGAGYSSLNLINELNFDVIKIDSKFFRSGLDNSNKIIVSSVVDLCHKLNKEVVAEGIEQSFEVDFLKAIDCDHIQGYYYSKPLPFEEALKLFKDNK